jgi:tripartite ATP-independent transporter DctM subunit
MGIYVQRLVAATDSFPLLAVPFFILVGSIMNHAGITRRLLVLAEALVGHWRGGLAQANVALSALMGGLSASANADAAMEAKMLGPEMVRRGYSPAFVAAITACSAIITPILPPGIGPSSTGSWPMSRSAGSSSAASSRGSFCAWPS